MVWSVPEWLLKLSMKVQVEKQSEVVVVQVHVLDREMSHCDLQELVLVAA